MFKLLESILILILVALGYGDLRDVKDIDSIFLSLIPILLGLICMFDFIDII